MDNRKILKLLLAIAVLMSSIVCIMSYLIDSYFDFKEFLITTREEN